MVARVWSPLSGVASTTASGFAFTTLATAGANTGFRGVGTLPAPANTTIVVVPEPTSLAGLAMVTAAGLSGWRGWLALKHEQFGVRSDLDSHAQPALPSAASRIEMADLKERVRKLEQIASGIDL